MANFSNYAESGILNFLFRSNSNSFAAPGNLSLALCSTVPTESQNGSNIPEVSNAGNYARYNLGAPANATFTEVTQDPNSSGTMSNTGILLFNTASANWGMVSGVALVTSNTYGAGEMIAFAQLVDPRDIKNGDTFRYPIGNLSFYLG